MAIAIRVGKSLVGAVVPGDPSIIPILGLIGTALIGPLLWLYVLAATNPHFQFVRKNWLHFLMPILLILPSPIYSEAIMFQAYQISIFALLIYLVMSTLQVRRYTKHTTNEASRKRWFAYLLSGITVIWLVYLIQLYGDSYVVYFSVTTVTALVLYSLSLWSIKQHKVFGAPAYTNGQIASNEMVALGQKIERILKDQELFKDSQLTIQKLAKHHLQEPPYLVSKAINAYFQKTFPDVLNTFRIQHIQTMLQSEKFAHWSVEAIAYESGFHSSSAFYAAFKKMTGMTPKEFRQAVKV